MAPLKSKPESRRSICRLCGRDSEKNNGISETARNQHKQLVNILDDDEPPRTVCKACSLELQQYSQFRKKCEQSDKYLRSMLSKKKKHSLEELSCDDLELASEWAVCRLCLDGSTLLIGIFSDGDQIKEDIVRFVDVTVTADDGLPQLICEGCLSQLQRCIKLKSKCEKTKKRVKLFLFTKKKRLRNPNKEEYDADAERSRSSFNEFPNKIRERLNQLGQDKNDTDAKAAFTVNQCQICRKQLNSRAAYLEHARAHRRGRRYVCEQCGLAFALAATLRKHLRIHNGVLPYQCAHCPYRSHVRHALTIHIRNHTGEKPYACPYCESTFVTSSGRAAHVSVHDLSGNRIMYNCKECLKSYVHRRSLLDHVSTIHRRLKRHKCEICDKRLATGTSLSNHRRKVHKIKPYLIRKGRMPKHLEQPRLRDEAYPTWLCDQCTAVFLTEAELLEHIDTRHKPQQCKVCSKIFYNRQSYKAHLRAHENGRSFICEHCGKTFAHMSTLRKHRGIHAGVRPFQCPKCKYSARLKHMLVSHLRVHLKKEPGEIYSCLQCVATFSSYKEKSMHTMLNHPMYQCEECHKTYTKVECLVDHASVMHDSFLLLDETSVDTIEASQMDEIVSIESLQESQPDRTDEDSDGLFYDIEVQANYEIKETTSLSTLSLHCADDSDVPVVKLEKCQLDKGGQTKKGENDVIQIKIQQEHTMFHKCKECAQVYRESKILMEHIASVHKAVKSLFCEICIETFPNKRSFRYHKCNVHKPKL